MALKLKFTACIEDSCGTLVFKETTGTESASNSTGWMGSAPYNTNPDIADYHYARIDVLLPDGVTTKTFEFTATTFPTTDSAFEYEITAADLYGAGATIIPDGLYHITYFVQEDEGSGTSYTTNRYHLFSCNVECCVKKIIKKIATSSDCACDSTIIKNALYAWALLQALLANRDCGNVSVINDLLEKLNKICGFTEEDCGCN
jgi:hypothetical protein